MVGAEGTKGRTVTLHAKIDDGNVEDVPRLGVKGSAPVMTGALALHCEMNVPAGPSGRHGSPRACRTLKRQ
jgi:hypothetical protein